jgi:hypothetical protein
MPAALELARQVTTGVPTASASSDVFIPLKCRVSSITSETSIRST